MNSRFVRFSLSILAATTACALAGCSRVEPSAGTAVVSEPTEGAIVLPKGLSTPTEVVAAINGYKVGVQFTAVLHGGPVATYSYYPGDSKEVMTYSNTNGFETVTERAFADTRYSTTDGGSTWVAKGGFSAGENNPGHDFMKDALDPKNSVSVSSNVDGYTVAVSYTDPASPAVGATHSFQLRLDADRQLVSMTEHTQGGPPTGGTLTVPHMDYEVTYLQSGIDLEVPLVAP